MIDVRVAQDHRVYIFGLEWESIGIQGFLFPSSLDEPAIQQHGVAADAQDVTGTGDPPRCAVELELHHGSIIPVRQIRQR
jgi:hypothetical protein